MHTCVYIFKYLYRTISLNYVLFAFNSTFLKSVGKICPGTEIMEMWAGTSQNKRIVLVLVVQATLTFIIILRAE